MPWFRMYTDFLNDPKMIGLAFEDQRHFIGVLALKSDGAIDDVADDLMLNRIVAQRLWIDHGVILEVKRRLVTAGLIDAYWQPVAWGKRQFVSDKDSTATERKRRERAGKAAKNDVTDESRVTSRTGHGNVTRLDTEADTEADTETKTEEKREKPAQALAITPALLADFLSVRKAKRAGPLTATAIAGLQREADKAGITLEAAVTACCEFGWQGFNAGWYADRAPKPAAMTANRQTETAHMRQEREVAQGLAPNVARVKLVPTFDFVEMEKSNVALINRN
jgi:hypothetical protein